MITLSLGVADIAYGDPHGKSGGATTTGDVAEILESQYHVMEIFFEERQHKIAEWLAESMSDQIQDMFAGRRPNSDPYAAAMENIQSEFRAFLDADEISKIMPLTQQITAAQMGVNHRKKTGYNKNNEARPAFVDTGLYMSAFRAWVSNKMGIEQ